MLSRLMTRREQAILCGLALAIVIGAISLHYYRSKDNALSPPPTKSVSAQQMPTSPEAAQSISNAPPKGGPEAQRSAEPAPAPEEKEQARAAVEPRVISVAVMGAVEREAVYKMPADARVGDLIEKAGGFAEGADYSELNLAAPLLDATTLTVPGKVEWSTENGGLRGVASAPQPNPPQYLRSWVPAPAPSAAGNAPQGASPPTQSSTGKGLVNINTASMDELEGLPGIGPKLADAIVQHRPYTTVEDLMNVKGIGASRLETIRSLVAIQ